MPIAFVLCGFRAVPLGALGPKAVLQFFYTLANGILYHVFFTNLNFFEIFPNLSTNSKTTMRLYYSSLVFVWYDKACWKRIVKCHML